jgi:short-subunit dehydrogenase
VVVGRSGDRLCALAEDLVDRVQVELIVADVALEAAADRFSRRLMSADSMVHLLINNAGFGTPMVGSKCSIRGVIANRSW